MVDNGERSYRKKGRSEFRLRRVPSQINNEGDPKVFLKTYVVPFQFTPLLDSLFDGKPPTQGLHVFSTDLAWK